MILNNLYSFSVEVIIYLTRGQVLALRDEVKQQIVTGNNITKRLSQTVTHNVYDILASGDLVFPITLGKSFLQHISFR